MAHFVKLIAFLEAPLIRLYEFLIPLMRATCPTALIVLHLNYLIAADKEYKL